jgi:hypothetical protein
LFLSSLLLLTVGVGTSLAQPPCPKPVFKPFDETINAYATYGTNNTKVEFLPSVEDSTGVAFGYNMTGATVANGTLSTGSGTRFYAGKTNVEVSATNTCGSTTLSFSVVIDQPFYKFGEFGGHHYFRTPTPGGWSQADSMAKSIGGNLVAINSAAESYFISRAIPDTQRAWIGLNKLSGQWAWTNGDPYVFGDTTYYQNWCPGQPDNWLGGQNYACIHSTGIPVGAESCWDDAHSPVVPGTNERTDFYAIVEMKPTKCVGTIAGASNLYLGYGPQSDILTASSSGIVNLTYSWAGMSTSMLSCTKCAQPEFTPTHGGNYVFSVNIIDHVGCATTATKNICVKDIRDGSSGNIWMCLGGSDTSVASSNVNNVLSLGGQLGKCGQTCGSLARHIHGGRKIEAAEIKVYPNPTRDAFFVEIPQTEEVATVTLLDIQGKALMTQTVAANGDGKVRFDLGNSPRGMYIIEVTHGDQRFHSKVVCQ